MIFFKRYKGKENKSQGRKSCFSLEIFKIKY